MLELPQWKKLVDVQNGDHPFMLFEKENTVLMLLAEKRLDKTIGYTCSACKPILLEGDAAKIESLDIPEELPVVKKSAGTGSKAFLITSTNSSYVQPSQKSVIIASRQHEKHLASIHQEVTQLATDVTLVEPPTGQNPLLTDTSLLFSYLHSLKTTQKHNLHPAQSLIGKDRNGDAVYCAVPSLKKGVVVGGTRQQRLHVLHLLTEELLQQNTNVAILDSTNSFLGLSKPNNLEVADYAAFSLPGLSTGFSMRELTPGKNAFVSPIHFSADFFVSAFGLKDSELEAYFAKAIEAGGIDKVNEAKANQFTQLQLARIAKLIHLSLQGIFSHTSSGESSSQLGKAIHVNLSKCTEEAAAFFTIGFLEQIDKTKPLLLVFEQDDKKVRPLLELAASKFTGSNISILCHAEHEKDVPFYKTADFQIEMLANDAVITQKGNAPQRVKIRPTYSACSEN